MSLTDAQYTTLANHIRANTDPDVVAALSIRNDTELTRLYNLDSGFYAWRSNIPVEEYRDAIVWSELKNITAGESRVWENVTSYLTLPIDATKSNTRAALAEVFAANTTSRANLLAVAKKLASVYEEVFATGTGTEGDPGVAAVEGPVTLTQISKALNQF